LNNITFNNIYKLTAHFSPATVPRTQRAASLTQLRNSNSIVRMRERCSNFWVFPQFLFETFLT